MAFSVNDAIADRKKRVEPKNGSTSSGSMSITDALAERKNRIGATIDITGEDITRRYNSLVTMYNGSLNNRPTYGADADAVFNSQRDMRLESSALYNELDAYREYLGDDFVDSMRSSIEGMVRGWNSIASEARYYSQWESEDDFNRWNSFKDAESRQRWYSDNEKELADLRAQRDQLTGGRNRLQDFALYSVGYMTTDDYLKKQSDLEDIDAQISAIEAEMRMYEQGETGEDGFYYGYKAADDYGALRNNADFVTGAANRNFTNADKAALDAYDSTQSDGSVALSNGGYVDEDGNIHDARGNIVQYANAPVVEDKLGLYLSASEDDIAEAYGILSASGGNYATTWADYMQEGDTQRWSYLTEGEIEIYYYLLNTKGQEAAYQYLEDMALELGRRENQETQTYIENASGWEKVGLSILSVPMSMIGGVASTVDNVGRLIQGEDINPYSRAQTFSNVSSGIRSSTAEDLDALTGGAEIPWINFGLGDLYQAGMSMVDSIVGARIGGGAYQAIMSMGAASSEAARLYSQGATNEQIVMGALAAGAAEWVFEKYSIENLISLKSPETIYDFAFNALVQAGIEMSEEAATEFANIITNALIMMDESDWAKALEAHGGDRMAALSDMASRIAHAGVSGAFSGLGSGGMQQGIEYAGQQRQNVRTGQYINEAGGTDALMALAREMTTKDSPTLRQLNMGTQLERMGNGFRTNRGQNRAVGRLYNTVRSVVTEQNTKEIATALREKGFSKGRAADIAGVIAAQVNGETLTADQEKILKRYGDNPDVKSVMKDVLENEESGIAKRAKSIAAFEFDTMRSYIASRIAQAAPGQEKTGEKGNLPGEEKGASYEVSEDGKAHLISDPSRDVSIKGVATVKDGTMMLQLDDGSTVAAEDVSYSNEGEALIYSTVAGMNVSAETANVLVKGFNPEGDISAPMYALDIKEAYNFGQYNYPLKVAENDPYAAVKKQAWNEGRIDAVKSSKREQLRVNAETRAAREALQKEGKTVGGEYHAVLEDGITEESMTESQKMSFQLADQIAQAAKVNIRVYDGKNGEWGYYSHKHEMVYLNLNSTRSGKSMMAFTLGHELVHRAKKGSPAKYQAFADFLMEQYGKRGADIEAMIGEQLRAAREHGLEMTRDQAFEEVVAEACQRMLLDTDAGKKLARFGAQSQQNRSLVDQIRKWIREFMDKLREMFRDVDPDSRAAREFAKFDDGVKQILADMYVDMTIDAGEHLSVIQTAFGKDTNVLTNDQGEFTMAQNADGSEKIFNLVTWKNGGRETMEATLKREGYTEEEIEAALTIMDAKQQLVEDIASEVNENGAMAFPEQGRINEATLTTDIKDGHAVLSALVSNGDYPVNIDLLMVCKKRKAYQRVINRLCETGMIQQATVDALAIAEINKILGKYGFETACLGCFVESRRLRIQEWAQTIVKEWNSEVKKRDPNAKPFGFGKGEATLTADEVMQLIGELESGGKKNDQGNLNLGQGSAVKRMGVLLDKVPSLRRTLSIEDLITPDGLSALRRFDGNLFSMVKSRYGSNSPKFVQEFNPYNHELAKYGTVPSEYKSLREYLYAIGGARMQSFSDFIVENWFDYCQIVADLAARKLPMHTYTKEIALAKLFGMTGIKINMSLIPDIDRSMGKEYAGLTRNADGELELIWADKDRHKATGGTSYMQSINFADAIALQNDPRYSANVGTIAIGVSDKQIRMMLADPRIRMVIPYHSSGMNPIFADLMGTSYYKDYTNFQNTTVKQVYNSKGQPVSLSLDKTQTGKLTGGFLFNKTLQELGDARAAAEAYKAWCADASLHTITIKGETYTAELTPKFDDFKGEPNYYKLLEDFNPYDCITEAAAPQGDVQQVYPEGFEDILRAELKGQEKYRQKQEQNQAFDKAMAEIESYLENHSKADTVHYANQHGIKLGAKDKKLNAADKAKLKRLQEEGSSFKLPVTQNAPYRRPAYDEWDVSAALDDALDHADQHHDNLIRVGEMPHFISDMLGIEGDFYIYRNHAYENMVSEKQALKDSRPTMRKKKKIHFHDLGKQRMQEAILALENPIMAIADSTEKENPKIVMILPVEGHNDAPLYAAMSFYDDQEINGSFARKPHLVLTVAERGFEADGGHDGYVDVVNDALKNGRLLSMDKEKMRAYMPVIADLTRVGNIADSALADNIARFRKEINAFREKNRIDYKLPVSEDSSPRALLANAFEGVAQNDIERRNLKQYQERVEQLNADEAKLKEIRAEIKELSFAKGKKDTKRITELKFEANATANRIATLDKMLLRFEASAPLKNILQREKDMVRQRERDRAKEDLEAYRNKMEAKQSEILRDYRATREALTQQQRDTTVMEKEFIRLAKAYEKQVENSGKKSEKDSAKIASLKDALKEEVKKHRDDQKTWEREFDRLLSEYESSGEKIAALERKIVEQREKASKRVETIRDNSKKTAMRQKIRKVIRDLDKLLNRGDKKQNVKEGMKDLVAEALNSAEILFIDNYTNEDMVRDGVGTDLTPEEAKHLEAARALMEQIDKLPSGSYEAMMARQEEEAKLKSKLAYRMSQLRDVFVRERARLNRTQVADVLARLAEAYKSLENADQTYVRDGFHENVYQFLLMLQSEVGGTIVKDMSLGQLESLYKAYTMVLTTVRNANKMFAANLKDTRDTLANRVMFEVNKAGGDVKKRTKGGKLLNSFSWNNLKPVYAFQRIGSNTLSTLFGNVRKGQDTWARDIQEADAFRRDIAKKHDRKSWDMEKRYKFTSSSGIDFELSLEQIMSLYAYSKREQAHEHLLKGGFVFDGNTEVVETKNGIKRTYLVENATAHNVSVEILGEIISTLTAEQKAYVDEMQDYLSTVMGEKGNEVSMQLYGVKLFNEQHYFPLRSAGQYMERAKEADLKKEQGQISIVNSGFAKATTPKASNPVVLSGFMDVWAGHVNEMGMYHSFVLPMEDFRRVYNYASPNMEGQPSVSVNQVIQNAHGSAATAYIDQLYRDLNGGAVSDPRENVFKSMVGKFKKAAVFASASVVVQQPSAVGRAFALIDPKYFIGPRVDAKRHKLLWEEVKKYAPVAFIKEMGYFDTGMGRSAVDFLKAEEYTGLKEQGKALITDADFRDEVIGKAPALADELTWAAIWEAVKRETADKHPDMDVKSEEFLQLAGERFSEIIDKTQVYDSVLARSANMRSKSLFMNMATAFMGEPTTSINMIEDAVRQGKQGDKKAAARTIAAVYTSVLINSMLVSLVYAARDDDEDETLIEKYLSSFVTEMLDGMNLITYYPFLKDVWSLLQGWDIERADMSIIADVISGFEKLVKAYSKDTADLSASQLEQREKDIVQGWWGTLESVASLLGLPLKNIRRDINGARNLFDTIRTDLTGRNTTLSSLWDVVWGDIKDTMPVVGWMPSETKGDKLYDALVRGDDAYAERLMSTYKDENAVNYAVRQAIEKRYKAGEIDASTAMKDLFLYAGVDAADALWVVDEWGYELAYDDDYQKYGEFFSAVESGQNLDATIKKYLDNGVDEGTLRGQITSHFKPLYMDMTQAERAAIRPKILDAMVRTGAYMEEAEDALYEWDFEVKHGMSYNDMVAEYKDGNITREKMLSVLRERGLTDKEAETKLNEWDFVVRYGIDYSDREMAYMEGRITTAELRAMYEEKGKSPEEIDDLIEAHEWLKAHPQYDLYASTVVSYIKPLEGLDYSIEDTGMDIDTFLRERAAVNEFTGDTDENGKSIPYSKINKAFPYIDSLPLTSAQKTALAVACGWSLKTVEKNKLW